MSKCLNNCQNCNNICTSNCPICGIKGKSVPLETLKNKIIMHQEYIMDEKSYICINRKCNVVYYQESNPKYFITTEIEDEVWFKSKGEKQIICYCHHLTLKDIIEIVNSSPQEKLTKEQIFKLLKLELNPNCLKKNPIGTSCDKLFQNAIDYAYKQKENK